MPSLGFAAIEQIRFQDRLQVRVDGESALQVFLRLAPARFHGRCTVVKLRQQLGAGGEAGPGIRIVGLDVDGLLELLGREL